MRGGSGRRAFTHSVLSGSRISAYICPNAIRGRTRRRRHISKKHIQTYRLTTHCRRDTVRGPAHLHCAASRREA